MNKFHPDPIIEQDMFALTSILHPLLAQHLKTNPSLIRVLNLACGRADETGALTYLFAHQAKQLQIIGIDIRNREISHAQKFWKTTPDISREFLVHDASKLFSIQALRQPFDLVFMRHQNFWNGDITWSKIYDNALHALKPNAALVITSYFDREHLQAINALTALGAELITTIKNPSSRPILDAPHKSADRHVALFKIPSTH